MLTIECNNTFEDGQILRGRMHAKSAKGTYPIEYTGATDRLNRMPKSATPIVFELLFATAIYGGAIGFGVNAVGQYDFGPKYVPNDRLMEVQRHRERYLKG